MLERGSYSGTFLYCKVYILKVQILETCVPVYCTFETFGTESGMTQFQNGQKEIFYNHGNWKPTLVSII